MNTCQNVHLAEWTFPRKSFSIMDTCQNVHLMLAIIQQDDEIKLFCSVSRVNIYFISGLVLWQKNFTFLWQKKVLWQKNNSTVLYISA